MKFVCALGIFLLFGCAAAARKNWGLLIAGSNTWVNYRHQADICHAYQILHKNGIPDEQIVVMMYDDIAHNEQNPKPGNIINRPNGPNVYPGVPKDYTGKDVIPKVFFAALQGQKDKIKELTGRSGKVIESGPDDHIFVYFADHGGPGILGMPGVSPYIKAPDLNNVLKNMHKEKKFAKLVFYVEACESGSIFDGLLPDNINIYVTTAANPNESSYAWYYDEALGVWLGDYYSIAWMEDTDNHDVNVETFETQFKRVKARVNTSHVQQYGDKSFTSDVLAEFLAPKKMKNTSFSQRDYVYKSPATHGIPSEMVPMFSLKQRIAQAPADSELKARLEVELVKLQKTMMDTHDLFWRIARTANRHLSQEEAYDQFVGHHEKIKNWDCYETTLDTLVAICPGLNLNNNDFALRKLFVLVNLCNNISQGETISAIESAASVNPVCHI